MSEYLIAGGTYYSLVYDTETKMYGYTRPKVPWTWAKDLSTLRKLVGGF